METTLTQEDIDWINENLDDEGRPKNGHIFGGAEKKLSESGGKAWQKDAIDRTVPYKQWINSNDTQGFWLDADAIKWRKVGDVFKPFVITELTVCDWETTAKEQYLKSIEERIFKRDAQGSVIAELGKLLSIPVYWVVIPPSIDWIYAFSFQGKKWKLFKPASEWIEFLRKI